VSVGGTSQLKRSATSPHPSRNRSSGAPRKLLGVEAARGIAAVLVVALHASHIVATASGGYGTLPLWGLFKFGRCGVDFFFVLSGFIIYHVHQEDIAGNRGVRAYGRKRLIRIYPTYWAVLAIYGVLLALSPQNGSGQIRIGELVASIFLWPQQQAPILGVAWTLRHELLFYSLFGLLLFNRTLGRIVLTSWAILIILNMAATLFLGSPPFGGIAGSFLLRVFNIEFFFGMAVAMLVSRGSSRNPIALLVLGSAIFFGNGLMESFGPALPNEWPPRQLMYALGAALMLYGAVRAERTGQLRVPSWLVRIGSGSYSIYLTHVITVMVVQHALEVSGLVPALLPEWISFVLVAGSAVVTGVLFSETVEQPLLRILRPRKPARLALT
jgi:exopolysaccharide production protein ExoZ